MKWFVHLGKAQMEHVSPSHIYWGIGTERQIQDVRPADQRKFGKDKEYGSLSVNELLTLHDPTFPDMYEWIMLSSKDNSDRQLYPQTISAPIAAVEEEDGDIPEIIATTPLEKWSLSSSSPDHDPLKDNEQYDYAPAQIPSNLIAEASNTLLDIAAVAKMDVDTPEVAPSPNLLQQNLLKQLQASTAGEDSMDSEDLLASKDIMGREDFIDKFGPVGISHSAIASKKLKASDNLDQLGLVVRQ